MAINSGYYIDAADLSSATAVYLNVSLSNKAPDGFYSDGTIVRQQSSGVLISSEFCPLCAIPCNFTRGCVEVKSVSLINVNLGSDTGVVIVKFNSSTTPNGIKVTYDSVIYNKLSSATDGVHKSSTYGNYTLIGDSAFDCDLTGNTTVLADLPEYGRSSDWYLTGNLDTVTVAPGDVSLSLSSPDTAVMIIPKPNADPGILNIAVLNACGTSYPTVSCSCVTTLQSFLSSAKYANRYVPCGDTTITCYVGKVRDVYVYLVELYDYVFSDENGQYPLVDGWYRVDSASQDVIRVQNGVVTDLIPCLGACVQYEAIAGATGGTINYVDCINTPTYYNLLAGETQTFCGREGGIISITGGITINTLGACP